MKSKAKRILAFVCAIVLIVSSIVVWEPVAKVEAASFDPVYLSGFEHVTTSNFYDAADVQMADSVTADADLAGIDGEIIVPYKTLKDSEGTVLESLDKTVLSLKVDFEENTSFMTNTNLMVGASQNWVGLLVRPQNNNELRIQTYGGVQSSPTVYFLKTDKVTSMAEELTLQLSFEYGDFDSDSTADDVKLGVYINGATCTVELDGNVADGEITSDNHLMFYNCDMTKLGTQMILNTLNRATYNTGDITVSKVIAEKPELPELVVLNGFEHVTTSNFYDASGVQMTDSVTADADSAGIDGEIIVPYKTLKDSEGTELGNLDKTMVSLKVDFEENTSFMTNTNLMVAATQNYVGFLVRPQSNEQFRIQTYGGVQSSPTVYYLTSDKVDSMAEAFYLQLSFEYGDFDDDGTADDVKVGAYINGAACTAEIDGNTNDGEITSDNHLMFYNCDMTKLGTQMILNTLNRATYNTGDITVSKVELPAEEPGPGPEPEQPTVVELPGFTSITNGNFFTAAGEQMEESVTVDPDASVAGIGTTQFVYPTLKNSEGEVVASHDKTLLSFKVDFEKSNYNFTRLEVAGSGDDKGFRVRTQNDTTLRLETIGGVQTNGTGGNNPSIFMLQTDKVASLTEEFNLQLSFEYGDFDNDNGGTADDVKVGVYINGTLCTGNVEVDGAGAAFTDNRCIFYNCDMTKLGTYMKVHTELKADDSNAGELTISAIPGIEIPDVEPVPGPGPEPEQPTVVELSGFTSVTTGNFFTAEGEQMPESVTADADADVAGKGTTQFPYPTLKDSEGAVLSSHDKTLLSVIMDFEKSNYTSSTRLEVAGAGDDKGFKVRTQDDDTLRLETFGGVQSGSSIFMLQTDKVDSLAEELNLQLSFEYGDFDNDNNGTADDVKVGVYINGVLCTGVVEVEGAGAAFTDKHCIFYNCDITKLGTYMKVYTEREVDDPSAGDLTISAIPGIEIPDEEEPAPGPGPGPGPEPRPELILPNPDFDWITFSHFGLSDKTYNYDATGKIEGTLDKKVFDGDIKITESILNNPSNQIDMRIGGVNSDQGFRLAIYGEHMHLWWVKATGQELLAEAITPAELGIDSWAGRWMNVKISTEKVGKDIKLGIWFDDVLYNSEYMVIENHAKDLGGGLGIFHSYEGSEIGVKSNPDLVEEIPDNIKGTVPNKKFKWITFDQFGLTDKNYDYGMSGKVEGTLDKTVFDGNIKIPKNILDVPGSQIDMRIGGVDSEQGFRLAIYSGHINLWWVDRAKGQELLAESITPDALGIDSWVDRWMNLKISMEKVGKDIKLGIWFDNVLYSSKYMMIKNHAKDLGGNLGIFHSYKGSVLGIKSNPKLVEIIPDAMRMDKPNENFKWLTFAHYGIEDGKYKFDEKGNQGASGRARYSMDKAVFSGDILLPKELSSKADIRIGGTNSWYGFMLVVEKTGNINFKWYDEDENTLLVESISPEKLGLKDWRGRWFNLKISTEIVAADKDGVVNDIKVGLWFDDVPCATKYIIVRDKAEQLGSYLGLLVWEKGMTVGVRSIPELIEPFNYEAFGLTKDWAKTLLNTGLKAEVVAGQSDDPTPYSGDMNRMALPFAMAVISVVGVLVYILGGYNERKKSS